MSCQLNVSYADWLQIEQCEAVVIREYADSEGERFAHAVAWGDLGEMEDQASMPNLCIIPVGVTFICQKAMLVKDLLIPKENNEDAEVPESKLN